MLFDAYEQKGLLFNMNFKEANGSYAAYRGDLVLELGEVGDALGHRKPPVATIKNTIVLAENDKIKLYVGSLDELALLPKLLDYYQADFAADVRIILFVVNINKPLVIEASGLSIAAIGMQEGLIWNELIDIAALDKGDFKGQSAIGKDHHRVQGTVRLQAQGRQGVVRGSPETYGRTEARRTRPGLNSSVASAAGCWIHDNRQHH